MAFGSVPVRDADASETFSVPEDSDTTTLTQIGFDHYRLEIVSARPRWVYVRLPYFPTWHALQPTGELRVHEASVHLMAICATGTVELVSRSGRIERVAAIMSATAWATALLTWLAMRRKSVMLAR